MCCLYAPIFTFFSKAMCNKETRKTTKNDFFSLYYIYIGVQRRVVEEVHFFSLTSFVVYLFKSLHLLLTFNNKNNNNQNKNNIIEKPKKDIYSF